MYVYHSFTLADEKWVRRMAAPVSRRAAHVVRRCAIHCMCVLLRGYIGKLTDISTCTCDKDDSSSVVFRLPISSRTYGVCVCAIVSNIRFVVCSDPRPFIFFRPVREHTCV